MEYHVPLILLGIGVYLLADACTPKPNTPTITTIKVKIPLIHFLIAKHPISY